MNLHYINNLVQALPEFEKICTSLKNNSGGMSVLRLPETFYSVFSASIFDSLQSTVLFLTAHPELAKQRYEQVKLWVHDESRVFYYPEVDLLSNTIAKDPMVNSERLRILSKLTDDCPEKKGRTMPLLIISSALSLASRSISPHDLQSRSLVLSKGMKIKLSALLERLQLSGYEHEEVVEVPGTYGKRGGIIDIFPAGRERPVRIEFFGDELESIREYDPRTQRSLTQIGFANIPPASELSDAGNTNLLDYLPHHTVILLDDLPQIQAELERVEAQASELKMQEGCLPGDRGICSFLNWKDIEEKLGASRRTIELTEWNIGQVSPTAFLPVECAPNYTARFTALIEKLPDIRAENNRIIIVSMQSERIHELLTEQGIEAFPVKSLDNLPTQGSVTLIHGSVNGGWCIRKEMLLLTDLELFGIIKQRRSVKARPVRHHWYLDDISIGDFVVHVEHGIGRFAGVTKKTSAGVEREYLVLEYADHDTLYVPVEQVDRVNLYIGGGEKTPQLSRLGSPEWSRARQKVKESVENIAAELIELYAGREMGGGVAFSPDTLWQQELEASFPYIETSDQLAAIASIKSDMESARPMDRLVCGDVGYGKTEIAVRAAFKAVMDGKQVAMLVPTTILAQQHMNTFSERLKAYPVKIEMMSRFCSHKRQLETIEKLADGTIDICIGTHRLLQKDVVFKDLGLAIIDEEQRFGVMHKEYFKKMRQTIDVLTLSATPIPRTMHMALSGIRDLSTIETPPENRLPVITYVGELQDRLVREAILRELERDGQVFIVHNRVNSIGILARKIEELVPEAKISVAHGQMDEDRLENIMSDFVQGKSNVLITTTIIESGLDMPNVNTLIVDGADKLGLTQLYQLRGRVGRGANTAYAYFLFNSGKQLTGKAHERLKTIARATELGAGFAIAMKDLEIRGAGNLLGVEQSGNIAAVGFNYYCQMLAEAVEELKAKRQGQQVVLKTTVPPVSIDLKIPVFIPEEYIGDTRTRFSIYRRLAKISNTGEVKSISEELNDRFGEIPGEVANLLYAVNLRCLAERAGVESVFSNDGRVIISVSDATASSAVFKGITGAKGLKVGNRQIHIDLKAAGDSWKALLLQLIEKLVCANDG